MMDIINNQSKLLGDDLKKEIKTGSKLRIAASYFSMYAYAALKEELNKIDELKFLFSSPTFIDEQVADKVKKEKREFFIPKLSRENGVCGTEFEIKLKNQMSQKAIAKECAEWIRSKVKIKSLSVNAPMQTMINVSDETRCTSYTPVGGFTTADLGYENNESKLTGIIKTDDAVQSKFFVSEFDRIWNDPALLQDVTNAVIEYISSCYNENAPEFIYFIILYNIFSEFLDDISEDNMPNEATGFKDTKLWNMLYDFQKDGAVSIINKLEKYNGCVLADSVGLGKTFTALAVILYYSLKNRSILVLCPKRLADNWNQYSGNKTTNIFYEDRLRYDVLYHTDLGRSGLSNGKDLKTINWGNYDLVVIDESHNFRNNNPVKDKETRYDFLVNRIMKAGVKTKVLMLSATPVNNRYNDLKNQLALAYCGDYAGFENSLDTEDSVAVIFRRAQAVFNSWSKLPPEERDNKDLIDSLDIDFKILLDSVTIARSRKNIVKYYNTEKIGKFPSRRKPVSYYPELTDLSGAIAYKEIYECIKKMTLSVYAPFDKVFDSKKDYYERMFDVKITGSALTSKKKNRDSGIKRLMTVNLLKRLESSVEAFRKTMKNLYDTNERELNRIETYLANKQADIYACKKIFAYENFDTDEDGGLNLNKVDTGNDVRISFKDIDVLSWKNEILADMEVLKYLIGRLEQITPNHDFKLNQLKQIILDKINHPINEGNKKVLIFTAFADTADYLYKNIMPWVKNTLKLNTAKVVGGNKAECNLRIGKSTDTLLTAFSSLSKNRDIVFHVDTRITGAASTWSLWGEDAMKDIDILIGTDCISEGQNLQDCDMCVNYDIHWNPVRIVQRFGRIDRLGSKNKEIQLINFWPTITLDEYIKLSNRIESRMTIVDQTATADDNILNPEDEIDDYRTLQIKKMQNGEVQDLEDNDNNISITDLGLNEFRMDATAFIKEYGEPHRVPSGMHCVVTADSSKDIVPGVIFVLRNRNQNVNINQKNRLHPYYLVYLNAKGEIVNTHLQVNQILDILRSLCKGEKSPIAAAYRPFNRETDDGANMKKYNRLLEKAIESIISIKEENDLNTLFTQGSFVLDDAKLKGLDDFELLSFVVIKDGGRSS